MCRHSAHNVFYYEFAYIGNHSHYEDPTTGKPKGAAHHDDMIYLFTLSYQFPTIEVNDTNPDSKMVDTMTGLWYNFAKYGYPSPPSEPTDLPAWPAMTPSNRRYMRIAQPSEVRANMFEDRFQIWEELYPMNYGPA